MKFMLIVKANADSEAGKAPSIELLQAMGKFNDDMVKAGVMLAGEGLAASSQGARIKFTGDQRSVIDGPFAETKELIAGFWIIQAKSLEEAVQWARRAPNPMPDSEGDAIIEVRRIMSADDFAPALSGSAEGQAVLDAEKELRRRTDG